MAYALEERSLEEAFTAVEETILPTLSAMLDTLLDTAALARAGADAEGYAGELRRLALELEAVTRQIEALSVPERPAEAYRAA